MDVAAVRRGIADAADTIDGLLCLGYVPDAVDTPAFFPAETTITYGPRGRPYDVIEVTCQLLVSRAAEDEGAQALMDGYLAGSGATSLKAAIEGRPGSPQTLGGACHNLTVDSATGYQLIDHAGIAYLGAEIVVRVVGSGS